MSGWIKVEDELPPVGEYVRICVESTCNGIRRSDSGVYQDGKHEDDGSAIYDETGIGDLIPKGWYIEAYFDGAYVHYREKSSDEEVTHWIREPELPEREHGSIKNFIPCPFCEKTAKIVYKESRRYELRCPSCRNVVLHTDNSWLEAQHFFERIKYDHE